MTKNKSYLNVLVVGAGKIGTIRACVIRKLSPKSKLYIFDTNFKKANLLAKEVNGIVAGSLIQALKNKEIKTVVVAVVNKYSKNICISALKNKKHVLCEKPMGRNYKEAKEIYKAVDKNNIVFKCGFNHRYHPALKEAYKIYKSGKIGKLLYIRGVYGHGGRSGYDKEWRAKKSLSGGGELLDQGSHLLDLILWFFDFEVIKRAYCIAMPMFWKMEVDDNAFILLETESGKVAHLHASWTQWKNKFLFEIFGTKGSIEVNGLGKSYGTETVKLFERVSLGMPPKVIEKRFKGYDNSWKLEWLDFIRQVKLKGKKRYLMSNHKESLSVMKTISMLYSH